jgi:hypothetical protein
MPDQANDLAKRAIAPDSAPDATVRALGWRPRRPRQTGEGGVGRARPPGRRLIGELPQKFLTKGGFS